jgi:hypothetical protein
MSEYEDQYLLNALRLCAKYISANTTASAENVARLHHMNPWQSRDLVNVWLAENKILRVATAALERAETSPN